MAHRAATTAGVALATLCVAAPALARQEPPPGRDVHVGHDSGWVEPGASARDVVYSSGVRVDGATWLRLRFATAVLGAAPPGGRPTLLRVTGRRDGVEQWLDQERIVQWGHTSAYFNGDAVVVEVIADPGAGPSRLTIDSVMAGLAVGGVASLCGDDDRSLSIDPRTARVMPAGCTAWLIDDARHCLLSAGHCGLGVTSVVEFNVPPSDKEGNVRHPPPHDQYAVDLASVRMSNTGIGDDWAYFGCFPNADTGLPAFAAQGAAFTLASAAEGGAGLVRVTGYGADDTPPEWDHVQQTDVGPLTSISASVLSYQVDTRGGNSGSPIVDETSGHAIGIHTNGGCDDADGANRGTSLDSEALGAALASPLGVCRPTPPVTFIFPGGLPDPIPPAGAVIPLEIVGDERTEPVPGTASLHLDLGSGFFSLPVQHVAPLSYEAAMPPLPCGTPVSFYFSVESTDGQVVTSPIEGAELPYATVVAVAYDLVFADDFQTDEGWTVVNDPGLLHGAWERGVPEGGGDRGDPPFDADGSGLCYVTGLADGNNDVDGGATSLLSPRLDATQGDAHLRYARWFSNSAGAAPSEDVMIVELSPDDGDTWTIVEVIGPAGAGTNGGWIEQSVRVADHVEPTTTLRVRFTTSDTGAASIVEAGVDDVGLSRSADGLICEPCDGDVTGDGFVGVDDVLLVILSWGPCAEDCPADGDGDGDVDVDDLALVLLDWGRCR